MLEMMMISDSLDVTGRIGATEGLRQNINTRSMSCGQNEHILELDAKRAQVKYSPVGYQKVFPPPRGLQ